MSFWQGRSFANWLRNAPVKPISADFFRNTGIENAQSAFDPVETVEFPRDVQKLYDQMRRGWTVGEIPGVLAIEGLIQLYNSVNELHAKLDALVIVARLANIEAKLDRLLPKECEPCPDHPEWAKDGCPWHRGPAGERLPRG